MYHSELRGERVVVDEAVHHFHAFCFHGVLLAELVLRYVFVVEIAHFPHLIICRHSTITHIAYVQPSRIIQVIPVELLIEHVAGQALRLPLAIREAAFGDKGGCL